MKETTQNEIKKYRSSYWDNIKGILVFLMVFAHILYQLQNKFPVINGIVDYIYMFHMPVFVFVSGYFGKSERSRSAAAIIRLLFLYFIFNSIMGFLYGFGSILEPMYSYWYLIALIVWRLTAHHLAKFREINLILFAIAIFAGFYGSINNTFAAARIIGFYPYYMLGYKLTVEQNDELLRLKYGKRLLKGMIVLAAAGAAAFFSYHCFKYSDDAFQMRAYNNPMDAYGRVMLFVIAFLVIYAVRNSCPDKRIPFLTMFGRNSLCIFLLHRHFTLLLSDLIKDQSQGMIIFISIICSFALCFIFGNDIFAKYLNRFADSGAAIFIGERTKKFTLAKLAGILVALGFVVSIIVNEYSEVTIGDLIKFMKGEYVEDSVEEVGEDIIYPVMSAEQKASFDSAFRITFSGDLILLEDQVKRAYTGNGYDFAPVFEYAEKYIASADYAIGVFEGPMAGEDVGYTSGNYDDGKEIYLNFPDSFAEAVKNAGFDLVTTANNHVLDKGAEGTLRTLDVLDRVGLDHTGSYRNASEKQNNRVKLVECDGIRMAVLSYTYGSNYYDISELTDGGLSYVTSIISGTFGEQFEKLKAEVELDFEEAKKLAPDLIIVLPHIGTQFSNKPDAEQEVWFDIFKECGADIILGDHPHVVEPAMIEDYSGRKIFTAYCPGNFANIYRENQGDTSMLIDVYIDRTTKQVIGGGIVPLYTQSPVDGNYRALPIYEIVNNAGLRKQLSTDDYVRAQRANDIITKVVFGNEMDISSVTERYYFDETGFIRMKAAALELTDEMKNGKLYQALEKANTICFIGDSLTEGTKNGGCPWYEPLEQYMDGKEVYNYSKGGCTVSYMNENADNIPQAGLYVIAVGTNDVRYRDDKRCAMTAETYLSEINMLKTKLSEKNASAEFIFIAPWYSTDGGADKKLD
ncbi:MAG: CapA family protein [Lachnospiraceae bacterium]|nr:CapA family protein [Lachnospiraceae bacterium]